MKLYIILASQEFEKANHIGLWTNLSKIYDSEVLICNIPSDLVVSVLKGKNDRIKDSKAGVKDLSDTLHVFRPFFFVRPELAKGHFNALYARSLYKQIYRYIDLSKFDDIRFISYNAFWVRVLKRFKLSCKIAYYLFDEVRLSGKDNSINKRRYRDDENACKQADLIFSMSSALSKGREKYSDKMHVLGNGADYYSGDREEPIPNSYALIGNFRNWIDTKLLDDIISLLPNYDFYICGPVESDMKDYLDSLILKKNVFYLGQFEKKDMPKLYTKFRAVIIPYKKTSFMYATRPIKIVESIMSATPVVSIPVSGYEEEPFLRFANDAAEFAELIKEFNCRSLNVNDECFIKFVSSNTWESKSRTINELFDRLEVLDA